MLSRCLLVLAVLAVIGTLCGLAGCEKEFVHEETSDITVTQPLTPGATPTVTGTVTKIRRGTVPE